MTPRLIADFTAAPNSGSVPGPSPIFPIFPRSLAFAQPSPQDIGQTIRDAVQEASQEAAQEARQQAREAQQRVREAQQEVREAQQHVREATTADQRGAAEQEVFGAQQQVKEAEQALRQLERTTKSPPFVFTSQPPFESPPMIPREAVDISIGFFITCAVIIVGWPIARALGRRFERRGAPPAVEAGMTDQLQRIEQAVEAIAIEVERISESQRFLTKLQEKSPAALE